MVVGSAGRDTLPQLVESFMNQEREPEDRLVIVLDSYERDGVWIQQHTDALGHTAPSDWRFRTRLCSIPPVLIYAYDSGYHWYGVEQVNWGLRYAVRRDCTHIFTLGDDDVFVKDAFKILRPLCAANMQRPVLYQFISPWRSILWDHPRMEMSHISGCCIAAPIHAVGQMPIRLYVEHDYDWMVDILSKCGPPLWLKEVLVIARPDAKTGYGAASPPLQEQAV